MKILIRFATLITGALALTLWASDGTDSSRQHWAFQPVRKPVVHAAPSVNPIDALLGTADAPPADARTLIRRMTYDLTGLPPMPEEVDDFRREYDVSSSDEQRLAAANRLIDRLVASPAYGEKWGRKWLDVARYADTAGENTDRPLQHAWRFRNYVIAAFNRDTPYDQFLREQIAGDLLAAAEPERRAELIPATGYLAIARRFGHEIDKDMHLTYEDVIDTVGKSVLGLSLGCARCHHHKYDPISMADYYGLYGIFASTKFAYPGCENTQKARDMMPLWAPEKVSTARQPFDDELAALDAKLKQVDPASSNTLAALRKSRTELLAREPKIPVAYAVTESSIRDAALHQRGEPDQPGEVVPRKNLDLFGGEKVAGTNSSGRLDLARWLTDPKNPLTSRVMMNRIWQGHFGRGLVATPNDFGTRGAPPTHPELLDWLAATFVERGWSVKTMHRVIMSSAAYQRAATTQETGVRRQAAGAQTLTPDFPCRRLEAEELRDTLLALSGELDREPAEGHPFPAENTSFTQHTPFKAVYDSKKRSVYLMTQRIQRHSFLALFDGPDANASTSTRDSSTVPTQALYFLNDPFFHARAEAFARRLLILPEADRITTAHRLCFQRDATATEHERATEFLTAYRVELHDKAESELDLAIWSAYARTLLASNELLYVD